MRLSRLAALPALAMLLGGCGGGSGDGGDTGGAPTPTPTTAGLSVTPCLNQMVPGTGNTVAGLVVPDTLTLDLSVTAGFPNGRRLADPVIDLTLAVIFLDLNVHSPAALVQRPLNPVANDVPFQAGFPYIAPPQGNPPLSASDGTGFVFVDQPADAYRRVDRMGMPAVATALIGSSLKNRYNDADPADDATGEFVPEVQARLTALAIALDDDLKSAGLTPCAIPQ
jgi:hypothetical protein